MTSSTVLKSNLEGFDKDISGLLQAGKITDIIHLIKQNSKQRPEIIAERKYTVRNILRSDPELFKQLFLSFDSVMDNFLLPDKWSECVSDEHCDFLETVLLEKLSERRKCFFREVGRYRRFVDGTDISQEEQSIYAPLLSKVQQGFGDFYLDKVLYEEIHPIDMPGLDVDYWHIDCLRDQLKLVIPLEDITGDNAPMRFVSTYTRLADYPFSMWSKFHTIFKIAGLSVCDSNYIDDSFVEECKPLFAYRGEPLLFNPKVVHTGTLCKKGTRKAITLYINLLNERNLFFKNFIHLP